MATKFGPNKLQPFVKCHTFKHHHRNLIPSTELTLHCRTLMTLFERGTTDASFCYYPAIITLLYNKSIQINFCFIRLVYKLQSPGT